MTPDEAFESLRQRARNQRRSLDEVCARIVSGAGTLDIDRSSERTPLALAPPESVDGHGR